MTAKEMLFTKKEIEGFELFNALTTAAMITKDKDDMPHMVMELIFDETLSSINSEQANRRKEKFGPLVDMLDIMAKGDES